MLVDRPACSASLSIERPFAFRSSRSISPTRREIASRCVAFATPHHYRETQLTTYLTIVKFPRACSWRIERESCFMNLRRIGPGPEALCGHSCPDIFELPSGDFAIIGADITSEATQSLPKDAGCGPGERIIRIPRKLLVLARPEIPTTL